MAKSKQTTQQVYDVEVLDPALRSRFMEIYVVPDPKEWMRWAKAKEVGIHPVCIEYVRQHPDAIKDPTLSPRTLHYISNFIQKSDADDLTMLSGLVGLSENHGRPIYDMLEKSRGGKPFPMALGKMMSDPGAAVVLIKQMIKNGRTDLLRQVADGLMQHFQKKLLGHKDPSWGGFERIVSVMPKGLQTEIREFISECQQT